MARLRQRVGAIARLKGYRKPATIDDPAILGEISDAFAKARYPQTR